MATGVRRRAGQTPDRPEAVEGSRDGLTRRAAEAELRRLTAEVKPIIPASEALTIGEVGRRYIAYLDRAGRKLATRTAAQSTLRVHPEPYFGDGPRVTHEDVVNLMGTMEQKGVGPKSIRNYLGTLSALYRFAMHPRRKWATANPCDGVELPAVPDHVGIRYLELDQVDALVRRPERAVRGARPRALPNGGDDRAAARGADRAALARR